MLLIVVYDVFLNCGHRDRRSRGRRDWSATRRAGAGRTHLELLFFSRMTCEARKNAAWRHVRASANRRKKRPSVPPLRPGTTCECERAMTRSARPVSVPLLCYPAPPPLWARLSRRWHLCHRAVRLRVALHAVAVSPDSKGVPSQSLRGASDSRGSRGARAQARQRSS